MAHGGPFFNVYPWRPRLRTHMATLEAKCSEHELLRRKSACKACPNHPTPPAPWRSHMGFPYGGVYFVPATSKELDPKN